MAARKKQYKPLYLIIAKIGPKSKKIMHIFIYKCVKIMGAGGQRPQHIVAEEKDGIFVKKLVDRMQFYRL